MNKQDIQEMVEDGRARALQEYNNLPWYQKHIDIAFPMFLIGATNRVRHDRSPIFGLN